MEIIFNTNQNMFSFLLQTAFEANLESRTCGGMVRHIEKYGSMSRTDKDNLKNFLKDPSSVSALNMKKFPKEVFSSLKVSLRP